MNDLALSAAPDHVLTRGRLRALGGMIGLVVLGDALLFDVTPGLNLPLFFSAVVLTALLLSPTMASRRTVAASASAFTAAMGSLAIGNVGPVFALLLGFAATALCITVLSHRRFTDLTSRAVEAARLMVAGPARLLETRNVALHAVAQARVAGLGDIVRNWAMPLGLGAVFLGLFAAANPIVELMFDLHFDASQRNLTRLVAWSLIVLGCWPLLRRRAFRRLHMPALAGVVPAGAARWFGADAILRALVTFNALFAVQTLLDLAYLWGGLALPRGMNYAQYAHRGAYPLIVTALIAAAFVLIALGRKGAVQGDRRIVPLVVLFTAQNIWLVISSMLRLELYVAAYSLTWMRVAAFLWMLLVGIGLVLILIRILRQKSTRWLISTNLFAALAMLFAGNAIDPRWIADHNLAHAREMGGTGQPIDTAYLLALGSPAIPALDRLIPELQARGRSIDAARLTERRAGLLTAHRRTMEDWRSFTLHRYRLDRYLAQRSQ